MWAVWEGGSALIRVQEQCHVLIQTHIVLFTLLLHTIKHCVEPRYICRSPLRLQGHQGASHARKQRNKHLQLWMDASSASLLCVQG